MRSKNAADLRNVQRFCLKNEFHRIGRNNLAFHVRLLEYANTEVRSDGPQSRLFCWTYPNTHVSGLRRDRELGPRALIDCCYVQPSTDSNRRLCSNFHFLCVPPTIWWLFALHAASRFVSDFGHFGRLYKIISLSYDFEMAFIIYNL